MTPVITAILLLKHLKFHIPNNIIINGKVPYNIIAQTIRIFSKKREGQL